MQIVLVYLQPFWCNSFLKCVSQPEIAKNSLILRVQGQSRSSMLTFLRSSSPVLVIISSMFVLICNHFFTLDEPITLEKSLLRGCPFFSPRSWGTPSPSGMKFCHKILETKLSYGENQMSLSHLSSDRRYRVVTDRHQDRITIANTRYRYASSRA